jgi:histidinol dehydrogenase
VAIRIHELNVADSDFDARLNKLLARERSCGSDVEAAVREIIDKVREHGDAALLEYTQRFDHVDAATVVDLELPKQQLMEVLNGLNPVHKSALEQSAQRIRHYHERQRLETWEYDDSDGNTLGQRITPLDRVGIYVPGGQAAYPSSVLMNAIPARVAGVAEVIMVVPTPNGELNDLVLAAAALSQVDRVFGVGGAQAVAALAYGTDTVPAVDKIVGPGNIYVATAKRLLYGQVGIDMIAGPSEVVVVCDDSVDPDWVAMDMFAQAEHDELAQSIVISSEAPMLAKVKGAIERLLPMMERESVIRTSLARQGALIHVDTLAQAADVVNRIAPEHLELLMREARVFGNKIRHAGAIFVDRYSAESLGDYCAGPNHVLPTSGTARFSSPLGVYDFQKRTSIIQCSEQGASVLARTASVLARCEQLTAHARSAEYRIKQDTLTNRPGDTGVRGKRQK